MARRGGRSLRAARSTLAKRGRDARREESVATVCIESIAAGGDGVGRLDGLACFVPRTAPGDVAQVALQVHARHARGRVLQLLEVSPLRVDAACRHYDGDRCGGCQLQHLNADAQRDARLTMVQEALRRIGKREVPRATLVSGAEWAYRGRLTLTLRPRGGTWIGGLHPYDDASRVFALEECAIAHPSLVSAWHAVRAQARGLPVAGSLRLAFRQVALRGVADAPAVPTPETTTLVATVVVVSGGIEWPDGAAWGATLLRAHADLVAAWWERADGERQLLASRESVHDGRDVSSAPVDLNDPTPGDRLPDELSEHHALVEDDGPGAAEALAFAQVNEEVAAALRSFVLERVLAHAPTRVVDAYAGIGILSALLAAAGVHVTAIEADHAGAQQARRRLRAMPQSRVVCDTVEAALASSLPADVVVLNPPRRGVDVRVTALLAEAADRGLRAIVYVSCDPATLARDVARLPAWRIAALRCFDMFPQTAHIESVCVLVPEGS